MSLAEQIIDNQEMVSQNWFDRAIEAYDVSGQPNFIDSNGNLIEGIYLNLPNDVYHSLDAISSTKLKKFIESPAFYYREYCSDISRKRTTAMQRTFDAGTYGHELCLEPQGFYDRYFRDLMPTDHVDALSTISEIETELVKHGLSAKESKDEKIDRLLRVAPHICKDTLTTVSMIDAELVKHGQSKTESKYDKGLRLLSVNPNIEIFDILFERNRVRQGLKTISKEGDEDIALYGNKKPIDPVVWDDAHRVQKTVLAHSEARRILEDGLPEVTIISVCPITKMWLKVKYDWLRFDGNAADVKTTQSTKPEKFKRQIRDLHYDIQQVFYQYVAALQGVVVKRFSFIAVEYIHADICQPYELPEAKVKKNHLVMLSSLKELDECIERNHWYGWSKQDVTMILH